VESGVRLVTIASGRRFDQAWDTHRQHFPLLKQSLLPYADRAMSALIEELAERGLLDETLVVFMGEFGRTPRLGQITSGAGADGAGRDHWPHCYSVLFAGGGTAGGAIYGASDKFAAYPHSNPVTPEDVAATIYHALGISPETQLRDHLGRPHALSMGKPIPIFG
jgi:arylsulfatase A-like enzyme